MTKINKAINHLLDIRNMVTKGEPITIELIDQILKEMINVRPNNRIPNVQKKGENI